MGRSVYAIAIGQFDNLGDAVLRREFLEHVLESNTSPVGIFVGDAPDDYVQALLLSPDARVYRSLKPWLQSALRSLRRGNLVILDNAGEIVSNWHAVKRMTLIVLMKSCSVVVPNRRCVLVRSGAGFRVSNWRIRMVLSVLLRFYDLVAMRDEYSTKFIGKAPVIPDPARGFATPAGIVLNRSKLAIALRGDQDLPASGWFDAVVGACSTLNLSPVVVSQVRRDNAMAASLAAGLGCELIIWEDSATMLEQERLVRSLYRECAGVLSDRLHALLIGVSEGAAPVPMVARADAKLERTLHACGLGGLVWRSCGHVGNDVDQICSTLVSSDELSEKLHEPRRRLLAHYADVKSRF